MFEDEVPVSLGTNRITQMLESDGEARIASRMEDRPVSGTAALALQDTCVAPRSSALNFTIGANGNFTLEDLAIYADGPAILSDGETRVEVQHAALRLYGVSHGTMQEVGPAGTFVIPPDAALFVISGDSGFAVDTRLARNATPLLVHQTDEGWVLDAFILEHERGSGEIWRLMLPSTIWKSQGIPSSE